MPDPGIAVPHHVVCGHPLDGDWPPVCQNELPFRDAGQHGGLGRLPPVVVAPALGDGLLGDVEHHGPGGLVDLALPPELLQSPLLPGDPGQYPGLDGGVVADDEGVPWLWDEGGADQLRQRGGHVPIEELHSLQVPGAYQRPAGGQVRHFVLGQVLQLNAPTGIARDPHLAPASDHEVPGGGLGAVHNPGKPGGFGLPSRDSGNPPRIEPNVDGVRRTPAFVIPGLLDQGGAQARCDGQRLHQVGVLLGRGRVSDFLCSYSSLASSLTRQWRPTRKPFSFPVRSRSYTTSGLQSQVCERVRGV